MEVSVLFFFVISLKCLCDSDTLNAASLPSRQARGQRGIMGSRYLDNAWSPSVFGFHVSLSYVPAVKWTQVKLGVRRSVGCEQWSSDCLSPVKCVVLCCGCSASLCVRPCRGALLAFDPPPSRCYLPPAPTGRRRRPCFQCSGLRLADVEQNQRDPSVL